MSIKLIVDYRVFVIDSLDKLMVLDDVRITTEERFRCRNVCQSKEHPKRTSSITVRLDQVRNLPFPSSNIPVEVR